MNSTNKEIKNKIELDKKKNYEKPTLSKLGDISSHTLGNYPGTNDQGNVANAKF